ncbi:MAG TPA: hypothetical protein VMV54_06795 [Acidocella sp.]|nr:hypothetical protein [Acidocella sp.]
MSRGYRQNTVTFTAWNDFTRHAHRAYIPAWQSHENTAKLYT